LPRSSKVEPLQIIREEENPAENPKPELHFKNKPPITNSAAMRDYDAPLGF
jgi:hypothetical protein